MKPLKDAGICVGCGVMTLDDGEGADPRGPCGLRASAPADPRDFDLVGPELPRCYNCADHDTYKNLALDRAFGVWTAPSVRRLCVKAKRGEELTEFVRYVAARHLEGEIVHEGEYSDQYAPTPDELQADFQDVIERARELVKRSYENDPDLLRQRDWVRSS
jgi:hypothetical protein